MSRSNLSTLVVREGTGALMANDQAFQVTRTHGGRGGIMCRSLDASRVTGVVELIKLPDWPDMAATNIALQLPQSRQETIRMVLNKVEKTWYRPSDPLDNHLPAVIERQLPLLSSRLIMGHKRHQEIEETEVESNKRLRMDEEN